MIQEADEKSPLSEDSVEPGIYAGSYLIQIVGRLIGKFIVFDISP